MALEAKDVFLNRRDYPPSKAIRIRKIIPYQSVHEHTINPSLNIYKYQDLDNEQVFCELGGTSVCRPNLGV